MSRTDTLDSDAHRLAILRSSGLLTAGPLPELDEICASARARFGVRIAFITLIDADRQVVLASAGMNLKTTPRDWAFCDHTIQEDEVLAVPDARLDARFATNPLVQGPPFLCFYAGAPVTYVEGARLGAFCVLDPEPRTFSALERHDLARTAERVADLLIKRTYDTTFPRLLV
jgi:GAF domain-containing protein